LPAFLGNHGLSLEQIGLVLAAGTIVRIVTGPLTGRLADHLDARKRLLFIASFFSGLIGFAYNLAFGFAPLLVGPCRCNRLAGAVVGHPLRRSIGF
jgi:PPP family 3-phenylpropionic acid transporter